MAEVQTHWIRAEVIIGINAHEWAEDYGMTDPMAENAIKNDIRDHLGAVFAGTALADYTTVDKVTVTMGPLSGKSPR